MKYNGIALLALWATHLLWCELAHAQQPTQPPADTRFKDEYTRQEGIYQSKGADVPQGYVIDRNLAAYAAALPRPFEQDLAKLSASGRWLDIGAGRGQAILDYYGPAAQQMPGMDKAETVAVSIEDRRTKAWYDTAARLGPNKIKYLYGKPLGEYKLDELGRFEVITDLLGGFSYSRNMARFMEKTLAFLQVDGSFYTILQDVHSENGANLPFYREKGESYLTEIVDNKGSKIKVCNWLKHISCVQVTCELLPNWKPPVEVYRVQKTCDNVMVPPLSLTNFVAGTPPGRIYTPGTAADVPRSSEAAEAATPAGNATLSR